MTTGLSLRAYALQRQAFFICELAVWDQGVYYAVS